MEDFPWLPVAMIFIAFVGWLRSKIQEAAESRREAIAEREHERREGSGSGRGTSPYRERPTPSSRSEPESEPSVPGSFRELFEQLDRQEPEPQEPPRPERSSPAPPREERPSSPSPLHETPATPPPLPNSQPTPTRPAPAVPGSPSRPEAETAPPIVDANSPILRSTPRRRRRGGDTAAVLAGALRDRGRLRNALVLKEILDHPKGRRRS